MPPRLSFFVQLLSLLLLVGFASASAGSSNSTKPRAPHSLFRRLFAADSPVSTDGACGTNGMRCGGSSCCSEWGWCGSTETHCGAGCQTAWGTCTVIAPPAPGTPTISQTQCGSALNSKCDTGLCCSQYGWCGTTTDHCGAGCQLSWGSTCTSLPPPPPPITLSPPTPTPDDQFRVITQCTQPNTVAFTFDDGLSGDSMQVHNYFKQAGGHITFFVNGLNYGCLYDHASDLDLFHTSGHQLASHTWSHKDLTTLTTAGVADEMNKLSLAFEKMLGFSPKYMRPPYGAHNAAVDTQLKSLGFRVVALWDIDSGDSNGATVAQSEAVLNGASTTVSHITLAHDVKPTTAAELAPFLISWAANRGLKMVTLGECLGDPVDNWYTKQRTGINAKDATWTCA